MRFWIPTILTAKHTTAGLIDCGMRLTVRQNGEIMSNLTDLGLMPYLSIILVALLVILPAAFVRSGARLRTFWWTVGILVLTSFGYGSYQLAQLFSVTPRSCLSAPEREIVEKAFQFVNNGGAVSREDSIGRAVGYWTYLPYNSLAEYRSFRPHCCFVGYLDNEPRRGLKPLIAGVHATPIVINYGQRMIDKETGERNEEMKSRQLYVSDCGHVYNGWPGW
jgi:hypothetical protein